ncbi:MAG: hypothetical protein ABID40_01180 [Candidatus Bipolaricaulota bacterium]
MVLKKDGFHLRGKVLKKDGFHLRGKGGDALLEDSGWILEWSNPVELEDGVTFGDVFAILGRLDPGGRALLGTLIGASDLSVLIEEAAKPSERRSDIDYIEVLRHVEISWYRRKGLPCFTDWFVAVGHRYGDPGCYDYCSYPVNEMLHCVIRLLPAVRFYDYRDDYDVDGKFVRPPHSPPFDESPDGPCGNSDHRLVDGKPCECVECKGERFATTITLGEFIAALLGDVWSRGSADECDEHLVDLLRMSGEAREAGTSGAIKPVDPAGVEGGGER